MVRVIGGGARTLPTNRKFAWAGPSEIRPPIVAGGRSFPLGRSTTTDVNVVNFDRNAGIQVINARATVKCCIVVARLQNILERENKNRPFE